MLASTIDFRVIFSRDLLSVSIKPIHQPYPLKLSTFWTIDIAAVWQYKLKAHL